ncbi:hypothetical protein TNCT_289931 [Trichonephila clavata]|uniref:Uncharacterized protein n=1 Tax=Trichonephila clavata TaxID=2740835 RepID=A0A8X6HW04_TRICU|nr:hypothetical protein TNCT_289931 [Trichonephila clavata]
MVAACNSAMLRPARHSLLFIFRTDSTRRSDSTRRPTFPSPGVARDAAIPGIEESHFLRKKLNFPKSPLTDLALCRFRAHLPDFKLPGLFSGGEDLGGGRFRFSVTRKPSGISAHAIRRSKGLLEYYRTNLRSGSTYREGPSDREARIERTTRHGRTGASFPANSNPWKVPVESGSRFDFRSSGLERGPTGPFEITFFFLRFSPVIPIFPQRSTRSVHFSEGLVKWIPKICFFLTAVSRRLRRSSLNIRTYYALTDERGVAKKFLQI